MLTLDNFRGVDFSSSPLNVNSNRAASMRNFILEDGRTKKRNGWKEVFKISSTPINGIFEYKNATSSGLYHVLIISSEDALYIYDLVKKAITYSTTMYSGKNFVAMQHDSIVFIIKGDYFLTYGTEDGSNYLFNEFYEWSTVYIPTTTISIDANGGKTATLDAPNLLTNTRKNKLLGGELESYYDDSGSMAQHLLFYLDSPIVLHSTVYVDIELSTKTIHASGADNDYGSVNLYDQSNTLIASANYGNGTIEFFIDTTPPIEDRDNITVTFEADIEAWAEREGLESFDSLEEKRAKIFGCTIGTLFGAEGANDRLFLSGNPDYPNMVYFSGINDFTYWPDTNYLVAGSKISPVNGFQRLADNTLAIYKAGGDYEPTIYYAWGDLVTKTDNDTGEEITDEVFYIKSGAVGEGCVSARACAYFAGDNIMLSKNGVFGIVLTDNVSTNERYARERSRLINSKLCQADLSKASAIVYKDKYYLALNDEAGSCFVANARYKTSVDDDIDGSYNYEWWYWDNVPARTWAIIDDQLWFGTDDGRICVFDDEYADRTYITTATGEIAFNEDHVTASSVLASDIEKANSVTFNADVYALIHTVDKLEDGRVVFDSYETTADENGEEIKLYDIFKLHEGMEVYVDTVGSSGLSVDTAYTVTDMDYGSCSYKLTLNGSDVVPASTGFKVYQRIPAETPLYIYDTDNTDLKFWLKATEDGDPLDLCAYNSTASSTSVSATFEYRSPVVAEWYTPVLDFGTNEQSKTLLKITVCAEATPGGKLSLGYDTRYANSHEIKGINTFSLNRISLQNFSFDVGFANSYSQKVYERNFNFLQFNFISDNDKNCIINSLSAIYKINKSNRGVR